MKLIIALLFLNIYTGVVGQDYYYENPVLFIDEMGVSYEINPQSEEQIIQKFLDKKDALAIEFNPNLFSNFPVRVKNKSGYWSLIAPQYTKDNTYQLASIAYKSCSVSFPREEMEQLNLFVLTTNKGTSYLAQKNGTNELMVYWSINFEELQRISDSYENTDFSVHHYLDLDHFFVVLKKGTHFALAYLHQPSQQFFQLTGFSFASETSFDEVVKGLTRPDYTFVEERILEAIHEAHQTKETFDIVLHIGYIYEKREHLIALKCRNAVTNSWTIMRLDPNKKKVRLDKESYSDIQTHRKGGALVYEVWNNGRVGFINEHLTKRIPCEFDAFQFLVIGREDFCAVQKEGVWSLYDAKTATLVLASTATTVGALEEEWLRN